MIRQIAIFYHCLLAIGDPPDLLPGAFSVVDEQMDWLKKSGLLNYTSKFVVGINGGEESNDLANLVIPAQAERVMHGLSSRSENLTILEIEKWVKDHPNWNVLYFHSKGATQNPNDILRISWRSCMMRNLVINWRRCVSDLDLGYDSVGCHWLKKMGSDHSQNYWAGNFWWAKSNFLQTLPPMSDRIRIKMSGISSLESRYESEVWIGNGKRLPNVKDYHPVNPSIKGACI